MRCFVLSELGYPVVQIGRASKHVSHSRADDISRFVIMALSLNLIDFKALTLDDLCVRFRCLIQPFSDFR